MNPPPVSFTQNALLPFETRVAEEWPPVQWCEVGVLVAVSGGADSIALLRALHRLAAMHQRSLTVAHFNHRARCSGADADEAFVLDLCGELRVRCLQGSRQLTSSQSTPETESSMRAARYAFLLKTAEDTGCRYLATAHTADDQAETILYHIIRGTGLAGLAGIPRVRRLSPAVSLVRPLLAIRRAEVNEYLDALGQAHRRDPSNEDLRFTRNRIRHSLIPRIQSEYHSDVVRSLLRLGSLAREAQEVIDMQVCMLEESSVRHIDGRKIHLDCTMLEGHPEYLVRELLVKVWRTKHWPRQAMSKDHWHALCRLARLPAAAGTVSRVMFPGAIAAQRAGELLLLYK